MDGDPTYRLFSNPAKTRSTGGRVVKLERRQRIRAPDDLAHHANEVLIGPSGRELANYGVIILDALPGANRGAFGLNAEPSWIPDDGDPLGNVNAHAAATVNRAA